MTSAASRIDYGVARNGARQLRRQWVPAGQPRAAVLIVHGICEHSGRYEHVGARLAAAGFATVAYDQRGHGKTEGPLGYIDTFGEFLDDVEDHLGQLRATGLPVVLLGHSLGGLISTRYAVSDRPKPDLLVLSGPALASGVPSWQETLVAKLAQLAPRLQLKPPKQVFTVAMLSEDPEVGRAYQADPLVRSGSSVQLLAQMFIAQHETQAGIDRLIVPTLCLHGSDDQIVAAAASELIESLPNVTRRVIEGLRHELFNEPRGPELLTEVVTWIDQHLAADHLPRT